MESVEQGRCKELAKPSSFYRTVYSEIEEIGWERLRRLGHDLTFLSFCSLILVFFNSDCNSIAFALSTREFVNDHPYNGDKKGRAHILEIRLDKDYPKCPPSVSADVPFMFNLEWSISSKLKNIMNQFEEHLERLQEFWSVLDDIDKSLCVVDAKQPSCATPVHQICVGNDCDIFVRINVDSPKSLPECRFMGTGMHMNSLRMTWRRNSKKWSKERLFTENLACLLEIELPRPPGVREEDDNQQVECGICYAQFLPIDDELGARSGTRADYTCDNSSCNKAFHSLCLTDWLRSISTTRQSFDVLFGNCPYCSDPVAVNINNIRK